MSRRAEADHLRECPLDIDDGPNRREDARDAPGATENIGRLLPAELYIACAVTRGDCFGDIRRRNARFCQAFLSEFLCDRPVINAGRKQMISDGLPVPDDHALAGSRTDVHTHNQRHLQ